MTPLPKRKLSHMRQGTRRASFKLEVPQFNLCNVCKSPKIPHRECAECVKNENKAENK